MLSTGKKKAVVGLDVEAGSIAAAEVSANGHVAVTRFGTLAMGPGVFREGEVSDPESLGQALKELFARNKLSKSVRLGLASQRVAVRTLRLPAIEDHKELKTAIRFQAQDLIPMPLDQAVLDWQVVGHVAGENGERLIDVVVVAARRETLRGLMAALRNAGLQPVGIDLSAFGMIRALANGQYSGVGPGAYVDAPGGSVPYEERIPEHLGGQGSAAAAVMADSVPARLYCNLGDVTNLAVARGSACLFTRVCPFGIEGIAQRLAERRQLKLEHARQWLVHVGSRPLLRASRGIPSSSLRHAIRSMREQADSWTSFASHWSTTPPRRTRRRSKASWRAARVRRLPGSRSVSSAISASASRSAGPRRSHTWMTPLPPA